MNTLIGQKKEQSQKFLENGKRIPVTLVDVKGNTIISLKSNEANNYQAVQLGFSMKKKASKAELGHVKGAKLTKAPKFLKEVRILDDGAELPAVGTVLRPEEVFEPGDMVDVSGISKGKGFQGGVKRWGFHGGPKTHGQSDRHRAPGSIGQGTTPGRVYKGKRMAGNMGNDNVTIKNLEIIDITDDGVLVIKGLVPGIINGPLLVTKVGVDKNFVPLYKTPEESVRQAQDKKEAELEAQKVEDPKEEADEVKEEKVEDDKKQEEQAESKDELEEKNETEQKAEESEKPVQESQGEQTQDKEEVKEAKEHKPKEKEEVEDADK